MKDNNVKKCKWCGREIAIITWGVYRKMVVDAEAVKVKANPDGEEYIRIDGSKVRGVEVDFMDPGGEPAYRDHRISCGGT